jgi:hypothetical protein
VSATGRPAAPFLGAEGVPELLRVPDVAGSTAGRGSVPSYPAVEAAVRALARVVDYALWLRTPDGPAVADQEVDVPAAKRLVNRILMDSPEGRDLEHEELAQLLDAYGIGLWDSLRVTTQAQALAAGKKLGWDVVLKATRVDGVYTDDPMTNRKAKKFDTLTFFDVLKKELKVMDATAVSLCMSGNVPIIVFNLHRAGNIKRAVCGEPVGTKVVNRK